MLAGRPVLAIVDTAEAIPRKRSGNGNTNSSMGTTP
jgi:hypothetical protein